jgi:hypothetical protein
LFKENVEDGRKKGEEETQREEMLLSTKREHRA